MTHMLNMRCDENGIEHRLTKIKHPFFTNFAASEITLRSAARWRGLRHTPKHYDHT